MSSIWGYAFGRERGQESEAKKKTKEELVVVGGQQSGPLPEAKDFEEGSYGTLTVEISKRGGVKPGSSRRSF